MKPSRFLLFDFYVCTLGETAEHRRLLLYYGTLSRGFRHHFQIVKFNSRVRMLYFLSKLHMFTFASLLLLLQ
jgi:hypothetical protein